MCQSNKLHNHKNHTHPKLSNIRSNVYIEMFNKEEKTKDDDVVLAIKNEINEKGKSIDLLLKLAQALCLQFRYKDALKVCDEVLLLDKTNFKARRIKAIRYMTTGQIDKSLDLFKELEKESDDKLDISYRIALCYFYKNEYEKAKELFYNSFSLCHENNEMYIAILYWYIISKMCLKEDISSALKMYYQMDVGHHIGYDYFIRVFNGEDYKEYEELSKVDNLTRLIYLVGLYYYFEYKGEYTKANEYFSKALKCDEYWSSFSGLAIWYKKIKETE